MYVIILFKHIYMLNKSILIIMNAYILINQKNKKISI